MLVARLREWRGLEAFREVVAKTQNMLQCGLLHSARDVEVMLVLSGKVSQNRLFRHRSVY